MRDCAKGDVVAENFLHHTAGAGSGAAYMRQMQDQHMAPGWAGTPNGGCDIAYNFVIDPKDLKVYEGRGWGVRPGAQKAHNARTSAVCVMGNFQTLKPTQGLLEKIAELIRYGASRGHIPRLLTGGHRDAPNQSTSCPGTNLYAAIPTIRTLIASTPGGDMPLNAADLAAIKKLLDEKIGPVGTIIDPNGNPRPFHQYTVNGVWHAAAGGKRTLDHLVAAGTPVDPAAVAALIADALGPEVGGIVAAELKKLTLKAT